MTGKAVDFLLTMLYNAKRELFPPQRGLIIAGGVVRDLCRLIPDGQRNKKK